MLKRIVRNIALLILILLPLQSTVIQSIEVTPPPIILPDNFNKVYNTFQSYNHNTDTSLVVTFCNVAHLYELDKDTLEFEWLLGQVLLESGAQQYKAGKLVTSSTGAVGFGQILRSTSLLYLRNSLTKKDSSIFRFIGVSDYSFAAVKGCSRQEEFNMARHWLSDEKNNIAMWGKIMSDELKRRSMVKALVSYNIGPGGLRAYIDSGCVLTNHHYIVGIRARMRHIK